MRPKLPLLPSLALGLTAAAFSPLPFAAAQTAAPLATPSIRITQAVEPTQLVTLKGNTSPLAQARFDRGAASTSMTTGKMQLLLRPSPAQQAALQQYLGSLHDPHSANYHQWLTPQAYGAQFGIAEQDLQTVESWLQSQGFQVDSVPASRNFIQFSGTVGQVAQAFHTSIHSYVINGVRHYSNSSDPQIPAALVPVVVGVSPLNDFHSKPYTIPGSHAQVEATKGHLQVVSQLSKAATPQLTDTTSNTLYITAADMATIYDSPNVLNSNYKGTTQRDGTGVNIGLVGDSDLPVADYLNYRSLLLNEGTSPVQPTLVVDGADPGVVDGGSAQEALVDAEFSAALAPKANIYFYSSADDLLQDGAYDAALRAVEDNKVQILSVSFGSCESNLGSAGNQQLASLWQQAAAQGITVVVASGDGGSAGCDNFSTATQATQGLAVSGFASTPYDIAVGGTDFDLLSLGTNFAQYVSSANGGGTSPYFGSALSYIPENPWNDSISNNPPGSYTTNTAQTYTPQGGGTPFTILAAGGGGPSSAAICLGGTDQNGNCLGQLTGYGTPSFQSNISLSGQNPNTVATGVRYMPDVSLFASPGNEHPATWAYCSDSTVDQASGTAYTDCSPNSSGNFTVGGIGGTSAATPAFAGVLAMVIQSLPAASNGQVPRLGLANDTLYNIQSTNSAANAFHDITAGNNSVPCAPSTATTPDVGCASNGFLVGYNAATGYDLATGLGSVDIANLIAAWDTVQFTATSTTLDANGTTAAINVQHGTAVTLSTTVTPSNAVGSVSVTGATSAAGAAVNEVIPLTNGAGSISTNQLPGGTYNIQAYYQGDVNHSPSTSASIPVNITPEPSLPFLSLSILDPSSNQQSTDPATANYGEYGYAYVQPENSTAANNITGSHGFATGTVTLTTNGNASAATPLNSEGVASFPLYNLAPGSYTFGASYSGDSSYNASSTTANIPLVIAKGQTSLIVTPASTSIAASASTTVTVELDTDSVGAYPSGAITLTANGNSFTGTLQKGSLGDGAVAELVIFTVPGAALAQGANTLQASYAGDANYFGATGSTSISVSGTTSTGAAFNLTPQTSTISLAAGATSPADSIAITPINGFTGTVNLACKVAFTGVGTAPTCSIAPNVSITGTTGTATPLTVSTTAQASLHAPPAPYGTDIRRLLADGGGIAFASVLLFAIPARRRSWKGLRAHSSTRSFLVALLAIGVLSALGLIGCGGTQNLNNTTGTASGTYSLTVTGTSGSITTNTQITINVQ